jgi:hypothetical protein
MSIIIRLVGNFINEKNESFMYELKINNIKLINYDSIKSHLISLSDLDEEKFEFINMTCDGKNLKLISIENIFEDEKRVWLFCAKKEIRQEIIDIFESNGYKFIINTHSNLHESNNSNEQVDDSSNQQLDDINNEQVDDINNEQVDDSSNEQIDDNNSDEEDNINFIDIEQKTLPDSINIDQVNQETIKLFEDLDFIKLFQIYLHKPVLFKQFYMYISNGNIPQNIEMVNNSNNNESNLLFIKNLNLGFSDEQINEALVKTNNHLNFSIRYLLYKKYEN